jgi:hypothetical protein
MDEDDRQSKLAELERCKAAGEKAYDDMYEAHSFRDAGVCYSDAKDFFYQAIHLAETLGLTDDAASLERRLDHIKAVFRKQFVQ